MDGYGPIGAKIDSEILPDTDAADKPNCVMLSTIDDVGLDPADRDYAKMRFAMKVFFKGDGGLDQDLELFTEILYMCYVSIDLPHIGHRYIQSRIRLEEPTLSYV